MSDGLVESWIRANPFACLPDNMAEGEWERAGRLLRKTHHAANWKIAIWMDYGERHFKYTSRQLADMLGVGMSYARGVRWTAARALPLIRRDRSLADLPFSAFSAVAAQFIPEDAAYAILREARDHRWTVNAIDLRAQAWCRANGIKKNPTAGGRSRNATKDGVAVILRTATWQKLVCLAQSRGFRTATEYLEWVIDESSEHAYEPGPIPTAPVTVEV